MLERGSEYFFFYSIILRLIMKFWGLRSDCNWFLGLLLELSGWTKWLKRFLFYPLYSFRRLGENSYRLFDLSIFFIGEICLVVLEILTEKVLGIWALDLDVHDIGIDYLPRFREFFELSPAPSRFNLILMVEPFLAVSCFLSVFIM
jgi:hypothetical protein